MYIPPDSNTKHSPSGGVSTPSWRKRKRGYADQLPMLDRPTNMVAQDWTSSWGVLGYYDYSNVRDSVQPDMRNYIFPSGIGRGWSGRQQLNGVSQLDSQLMVPPKVVYRDANGKIVRGALPAPYWQGSQAQANPLLVNRFGGEASEVPGPTQSNLWHDALYAGLPETGGATGGPGTLSVVAKLRERFGF